MKRRIKLCYIGGGSKMWARVFMSDLALSKYLEGELALYDIDILAASRNKKLGDYINENPNTISKWDYLVYKNIDEALINSDIVVISILPGTFKEMYSDVHEPEKYGIYQSVGDTVGPGGILRAMRTVPLYEYFADRIKANCPSAWVINLTNPMSICVKTLYDVFPKIKAFGCCHEVFHTQDLLCDIAKEELNLNINRKDIMCDVAGINHFTWFTKAMYQNINLLDYLDKFFKKHPRGYYEHGKYNQYKSDPFAYANLVKYDLYKRYGVLAAAGDRHLVEFMNNSWYLKDAKTINKYGFALTSVDLRIKLQQEQINDTILKAEGKKEVEVKKSQEEVVDLIEAILGFKEIISNVNYKNIGQIQSFPLDSIVETNCVFKCDMVLPITSSKLPLEVNNLVLRNLYNIETCYQGIKERNLKKIFTSFINQPLCSSLPIDKCKELFKNMILSTKEYLQEYYDLNKLNEL